MKNKSALMISCFVVFSVFFSDSWCAEAASQTPKVIILEFHGMKQGILSESLEEFPNFREMICGQNRYQSYVYIPSVLTTIPAASQPAVTSMYTGHYPERTGVVSNAWFDRHKEQKQTLISYWQGRINRTLENNGVESLFQYASKAGKRSMTSMLMLTNGADWSVRSGAFFWGNSSLFGLFRNHRLIPDSRYVDERTMRGFLDGHLFSYHRSLEGVARNGKGVPDLMVVELLGIDLFSHYPSKNLLDRHASMDEIQKYYVRTVLDPLMGKLIQTLKALGCYDDTIFVLVSDHGFSRIARPIRDDIVDRSLRKEFRISGWGRSVQWADSVVMPGACTKEIYIKNRLEADWMAPPRLLADVKPAVDLLLANREVSDSIQAMLIRQYPGERRESLEESDWWWVFDWHAYRESIEDDAAFLANLRPLTALNEYFELGEYLMKGLRRQHKRNTAPDIQLINKKGFYFVDDLGKRGHHGGYYPDDCLVSFWVAGPALEKVLPGRHSIERTGSTLDLVPMVSFLLGIPLPTDLDGENPLADLKVGVKD